MITFVVRRCFETHLGRKWQNRSVATGPSGYRACNTDAFCRITYYTPLICFDTLIHNMHIMKRPFFPLGIHVPESYDEKIACNCLQQEYHTTRPIGCQSACHMTFCWPHDILLITWHSAGHMIFCLSHGILLVTYSAYHMAFCWSYDILLVT